MAWETLGLERERVRLVTGALPPNREEPEELVLGACVRQGGARREGGARR